MGMIVKVENEVEMVARHIEVLEEVGVNQPIGIVNLSERTNHPQHKVRYSLRVLEENGLVQPTDQGAVWTENVEDYLDDLSSKVTEMEDRLKEMKANPESTSTT